MAGRGKERPYSSLPLLHGPAVRGGAGHGNARRGLEQTNTHRENKRMRMNYSDFLATKQKVVPDAGIDIDPNTLNPMMFNFQRAVTAFCLRKGRAALWLDTGLGKTVSQLQWSAIAAEETNGRALIFAPLSVAYQTVEEGRKFGIPVTYAKHQSESACKGITITNYERMDGFDPKDYGALCLDECFAAGTKVNTPYGEKYIEDIQPGDSIINACGVDTVRKTHRREVPYAIRITVNGHSIISSPNHPFLTINGWKFAETIQSGDTLVTTSEAVRMVRRDVPEEIGVTSQRIALLRQILLREMADEATGTYSEGSHSRSCGQEGQSKGSVVSVGKSESGNREGKVCSPQSVQRPGSKSETLSPFEGDRTQASGTWREWQRLDGTAILSSEGARSRVEIGTRFVTGQENSGLSIALQTRSGKPRTENLHRGRRTLSPKSEGAGRKEGCEAGFVGVDRVEVLELGHPELERYRDADGKLYFYDLSATRHPSYSVAGCLVHNSGILKSMDGVTRKKVTDFAQSFPYRLACTATPAPNDLVELANHAEFLGVSTRGRMLATYFINGQVKGGGKASWRLKGHARRAFFRWLASWAMALKRPSDIGFANDGFILPPLNISPVIVQTDVMPTDRLLWGGLKGMQDRTAVRRATLEQRVNASADLIAAEPDEQWLIWCGLDCEAEAMQKALTARGLTSQEVKGSDDAELKAQYLMEFAHGTLRRLVTKPKIASHGMNFQRCARMVFVGIGDSFESYYQCLRRCWRYGQDRAVCAYVVFTELEGDIYNNVLRKEREAEELSRELIAQVKDFEQSELGRVGPISDIFTPKKGIELPSWLTNQAL